MKLGIPVYPGVNMLDVMGPLEMFFWAGKRKDLQTVLISEEGEPVTAMNKVRFEVQASYGDAPTLDVVWVPGGDPEALAPMMRDPDGPYFNYLRQGAADAKWVCSVCEGALLLGRAGLLARHTVTTHWAFVACMERFPEVTVDKTNPRFVVSGNRLTGGGISSGLDESLKLISLLFDDDTAKRVQVTTQYFPKPPVM